MQVSAIRPGLALATQTPLRRLVLRYTISPGKSERPTRGVTDRQAAGYRNDRPISLKRAVGAARASTAAAGRAPVVLAQPTVSATGTAVAASTIVSRLDTIMPIRRVPARPGSGRHPAVIQRSEAGAPPRGAADDWC